MNTYRQRLQEALLRAAKASRAERAPSARFYAVCETVGCAAFLAGWAFAIISHL